tara:strand:+ start:2567 stop:3088 length:522 start_codon:yes stop_codon:yes gene_type:complete
MYQKLQVGRGITVIPDNVTKIYHPGGFVVTGTGQTDSGSPQQQLNKIIDSGASFTTTLQVGDVIRNNEQPRQGIVTNIVSDTEADIDITTGQSKLTSSSIQTFSYSVYRPSQAPNGGCILYIGTVTAGTDLRVLTAGGDDITLKGVIQGSYTPVQVIKVFKDDTDVSNIIALW